MTMTNKKWYACCEVHSASQRPTGRVWAERWTDKERDAAEERYPFSMDAYFKGPYPSEEEAVNSVLDDIVEGEGGWLYWRVR